MIRTTTRIARKVHSCEGCRRSTAIQPGDPYVEHVASPNHDELGNRFWWRLTECADCAAAAGRAIT